MHGILQVRIWEWVAFLSPGDLPNPGIKCRSPTLQVDSLPGEPQGKPSCFKLLENLEEFLAFEHSATQFIMIVLVIVSAFRESKAVYYTTSA